MFYVEFPLIEGFKSPGLSESQPRPVDNEISVDCGKGSVNDESKSDCVIEKRLWRWRDPRNNIDHKKIITPTSKMSSQSDLRIQSQKIIPQRDADITPGLLMGKHLPSSEILQPNCANQETFPPLISQPPLRILIVDDVKSIRKLFARALSNQGHSCDTACDGQECVDLFMKQAEGFPSLSPLSSSLTPLPSCPYDLVLMDSEMPVMNGPTATKIIRSLGFNDLVIFGVTGNVLPEDIEMFLNHGVDAVLGKPLTVEKMWEEYDRIIKNKSQKGN